MFDKGLILNKKCYHSPCSTCSLGESNHFSVSTCKTTSPFEHIHSDVWGPSSIMSATGYKYTYCEKYLTSFGFSNILLQ